MNWLDKNFKKAKIDKIYRYRNKRKKNRKMLQEKIQSKEKWNENRKMQSLKEK